jgi:hypothetical protein
MNTKTYVDGANAWGLPLPWTPDLPSPSLCDLPRATLDIAYDAPPLRGVSSVSAPVALKIVVAALSMREETRKFESFSVKAMSAVCIPRSSYLVWFASR